jgi:hypothetical protein
MNAGLRTLDSEINVQRFNDDLSRATMAANGLVTADTVLHPGEEERGENHADDHSYRAQLLSDHEETALKAIRE